MRKLSAQQRKLAEAKATGLTDQEACKKAKYKANSDRAACNQVARMMRNDEFMDYYNALLEESRSEAVLTIQEIKEWLSRAVTTPLSEIDERHELCVEHTASVGSEKIKKVDPLRAIDILNKLEGSYAAEKHEHSHTGIGNLIAEIQGS